jgi:hypothetical protein
MNGESLPYGNYVDKYPEGWDYTVAYIRCERIYGKTSYLYYIPAKPNRIRVSKSVVQVYKVRKKVKYHYVKADIVKHGSEYTTIDYRGHNVQVKNSRIFDYE